MVYRCKYRKKAIGDIDKILQEALETFSVLQSSNISKSYRRWHLERLDAIKDTEFYKIKIKIKRIKTRKKLEEVNSNG